MSDKKKAIKKACKILYDAMPYIMKYKIKFKHLDWDANEIILSANSKMPKEEEELKVVKKAVRDYASINYFCLKANLNFTAFEEAIKYAIKKKVPFDILIELFNIAYNEKLN